MPCEVALRRPGIGRIAVLGFGFALAGCGPHPDAARLQADAAKHHPGCRVFDSGPGEGKGEGDSDTVYMHIELRCDAAPIARKLEYADRREGAGWRMTTAIWGNRIAPRLTTSPPRPIIATHYENLDLRQFRLR